MTKSKLISKLTSDLRLTNKATTEKIIETFLTEIVTSIKKGEKVVLSSFGTFKKVHVKNKPVTVPGTGRVVIVKAHNVARFSPGTTFKREVK